MIAVKMNIVCFKDVPNPPRLQWVECNAKDAVVVWEPTGDNRAPILTYKIQYNTSFIPVVIFRHMVASGPKSGLVLPSMKYQFFIICHT